MGGSAVLVDELDLEGVEKARRGRTIVAAASAAQGRHGAEHSKLVDVSLRRELGAAIRVVDEIPS